MRDALGGEKGREGGGEGAERPNALGSNKHLDLVSPAATVSVEGERGEERRGGGGGAERPNPLGSNKPLDLVSPAATVSVEGERGEERRGERGRGGGGQNVLTRWISVRLWTWCHPQARVSVEGERTKWGGGRVNRSETMEGEGKGDRRKGGGRTS